MPLFQPEIVQTPTLVVILSEDLTYRDKTMQAVADTKLAPSFCRVYKKGIRSPVVPTIRST
jgi:hypothetical protein